MLADGGGIELLSLGCGTLVVGLGAICLLEAAVARPLTGLPVRRSIRVWIAANAFSALLGIIVLWVFGGRFVVFEPLVRMSLGHPSIVSAVQQGLVRHLVYFTESVAVEYLVWRVAVRLDSTLKPRRLFPAVVVANVVSYAVLLPVLALSIVRAAASG